MIKNKFIGQVKEYNRYGNIESGDFKMDLIDRKILYLLSLNARLSNTFIAKRLRIKRETVSYRIKRMNDEDFLHGTLALLDHRKLGFKNYLVYIKLKTVLNEKKLLNFLLNLEKVSRIKNCSGSYDIQIVLTVR